jgi:hypothetical protein
VGEPGWGGCRERLSRQAGCRWMLRRPAKRITCLICVITKPFRTYKTIYLRQEKSLRDYGTGVNAEPDDMRAIAAYRPMVRGKRRIGSYRELGAESRAEAVIRAVKGA